jgi:formate C-acetyltransferase
MRAAFSAISSCALAPSSSERSFAASAAEPAFAIPDPRPPVAKDVGINVSKYVQDNYTPYSGDSSFLAGPSEKTKALWAVLEKMCCEELQKGISGVDPHLPSTITAFGPGYIDKEKEVIVGLQTDEPLKRAIKPLGGINMVKAALHVSGQVVKMEIGVTFLCACVCCGWLMGGVFYVATSMGRWCCVQLCGMWRLAVNLVCMRWHLACVFCVRGAGSLN